MLYLIHRSNILNVTNTSLLPQVTSDAASQAWSTVNLADPIDRRAALEVHVSPIRW